MVLHGITWDWQLLASGSRGLPGLERQALWMPLAVGLELYPHGLVNHIDDTLAAALELPGTPVVVRKFRNGVPLPNPIHEQVGLSCFGRLNDDNGYLAVIITREEDERGNNRDVILYRTFEDADPIVAILEARAGCALLFDRDDMLDAR